MIRFFRVVFALLRVDGAWNAQSEWTNEDASALRGFLASNTGQRFSARFRYAVQVINASAVQSPEPWRAGDAAGYMRCVADIQALSAPVAPQDDQPEQGTNDETRPALDHLVSL